MTRGVSFEREMKGVEKKDRAKEQISKTIL